MDPRTVLTRGVATGLRLGRGTADRVVTLAGPPLARAADRLVTRLRRPEWPTTTTFTPSKKTESAPVEPPASAPSPATVARNIAPQRPSAKPARQTKPKSVPGAKLPPPRPSTT
jgi:hypothetical protein